MVVEFGIRILMIVGFGVEMVVVQLEIEVYIVWVDVLIFDCDGILVDMLIFYVIGWC